MRFQNFSINDGAAGTVCLSRRGKPPCLLWVPDTCQRSTISVRRLVCIHHGTGAPPAPSTTCLEPLAWCPKYRRPVLVDAGETRLKALLAEQAAAMDVQVEALDVMPAQVHLFVTTPPTDAPQHLATPFKGDTPRV